MFSTVRFHARIRCVILSSSFRRPRPTKLWKNMASLTRQQPPWQAPSIPGPEAALPPLKIWNSLTRSKTHFVPIDWKSKTVSWYACGPTVYDDAHLGHARNYVSTDIIRRILRDYFKYNVKFVMNITDVDDKVRSEISTSCNNWIQLLY